MMFIDWVKKRKADLGDELVDIAIYLLGLSEMLGKDLEDEIEHKMKINKNREYKEINGRMVRVKDKKNFILIFRILCSKITKEKGK